MALNAKNVLVGSPDQASGVGAILSAPLGTTLPTDAGATLDAAFADCGYISEDGLTLSPSISTADIKDWSGSLVRRIKESFEGTLTWSHLETSEASLKNAFGASAVTATAATSGHGNQLAVAVNGDLPGAKSWVFKIKDGDAKVLIVAPNAEVTGLEDVSLKNSEAIVWGVTLSCYPDSTGNSLYIYTDDGQTV